MKILIADTLAQRVVDSLIKQCHQVKMDPTITEDSLANEISDYNILIVRSKVVNAHAIENARALSLIIRAGAGVNTIDVNAASNHGVLVTNTPGQNNDAVAELAFGHIIACDRCIPQNTIHIKNGEWRKKLFLNSTGLRDRTLGLVGCGNISHSMIHIAKGFNMNVAVYSIPFSPEEAKALGVQYCGTLEELAKIADVVSVHVPYMKETHHLINKQFFDAMKKKAIFINTSRGEIVDTVAMIEAIKEKGIKVGLDVYENEPAGSFGTFQNNQIAEVVTSATCHIGASTQQASERIADETIRIVNTFVETGEALHCVNIDQSPKVDGILSVRHNGVFGKIIACCEEHGAKIMSVNNDVLKGDNCQIAAIRMKVPKSFADEITKIEGVIGVSCKMFD